MEVLKTLLGKYAQTGKAGEQVRTVVAQESKRFGLIAINIIILITTLVLFLTLTIMLSVALSNLKKLANPSDAIQKNITTLSKVLKFAWIFTIGVYIFSLFVGPVLYPMITAWHYVFLVFTILIAVGFLSLSIVAGITLINLRKNTDYLKKTDASQRAEKNLVRIVRITLISSVAKILYSFISGIYYYRTGGALGDIQRLTGGEFQKIVQSAEEEMRKEKEGKSEGKVEKEKRFLLR